MASANAIQALEQAVNNIENAATNLRSYLDQSQKSSSIIDGGASSTALAGSLKISIDVPNTVQDAKAMLIEATTSIQQLIMSPFEFHRQLTIYNQQMAAIRWLCHFDIPTLVPEDPRGIELSQLSVESALPETLLERICGGATSAGFFYSPTPSRVAHTPISIGYRSSDFLRDTLLFLTETSIPTASKMVEMTESQRSGSPRTAFQLANDTTLDFYPYLAQNPLVARRLASGMKDLSAAAEAHVEHLAEGYDWNALGPAHVLDIGGSTGHASMALASAFPNLKFTVQDLPHVVVQAQKQKIDPQIAPRIKFEAQNFLTPQPPSSVSADVFLIRQCLQNHPSDVAIKILRHVVPCMTKPHSRLIINNIVLPSLNDPTVSKRERATMHARDLFMMQAMNGQERSLQQWKDLLEDVDKRLEIVKVEKPRGSSLSVIEVRMTSPNEPK